MVTNLRSMEIELKLEKAQKDQVREICDLVNFAYRGEEGWTRETDIVQGNRSTESEIESAVSNPDTHLLVAKKGKELVSCICVEKEAGNACISLFAVHPRLQGKGVGKNILNMTEKFVLDELDISKFIMVVVSQRPELISYHERRGYVRTGNVEGYPVHLNVGIPKVKGLTVEFLEKTHNRPVK